MKSFYPNNEYNSKISVLINAYACNPKWGSEPGMGWNWVVNIAKFCEVFVITEGEWKDNIEEAIELLPQKANIHFFYLPVSDNVRKMCWNQGDWRFYYYYRKWQKRAYKKALQIISDHKIDIVHQLNMVGFREPGFLYKINNIPFVWGPIGGMNNFPIEYLNGAKLKFKLFARLKNFINNYQIRKHRRVRLAVERADCLISAVPATYYNLLKYYGKKSILIGETGCYPVLRDKDNVDIRFSKSEYLNIIWVGQVYFRKQLSLALRTLSMLKNKNKVKLHIVTPSSLKELQVFKDEAEKLNVEQYCVWHGKLEHDKVIELMSKSQLFFFTSVVDETSTVILEAIECGLPILCFDTCGFGPIVDETIGYKIELTNPNQSVVEFASIIDEINSDREDLINKSLNTSMKLTSLSWEYKASLVVKEYENILK